MTSRYRAGQRVAAIISELQDQGMTTSEIALELQQRGVLMRGAAVDPVADLCENVRDIVADFAEAIGQPAGEAAALRARAEAAEQRAEALAAEVARLRADALLLAGLANHHAVYEMDGHDAEALDVAAERADEAADGVVIDVIRRALWGVAEAQPTEVADV